jgi:glycolate oxidase iron-sulfur subunit
VIDAWWPQIDGSQPGQAKVEAIVMTASGCGAHVREYGELLKHDPAYAEKAARISALTLDVSEVLAAEQGRLAELLRNASVNVRQSVAFHSPCTLQHAAGYVLSAVSDPHLCCGSAGTYSITQPELSRQLRDNKLAALGAASPTVFVTANVGCQTHLQSGTTTPVRHWIELIDERLNE